MLKPYNLSLQELEKQYKTNNKTGLASAESAKRLVIYGKNALAQPKTEPLILIFIRQFKNPLIYLLGAATIFNIIVAHYLDAFFIAIILTINALISTFQEERANSILLSLTSFMKSQAIVIRDGKEQIIEDTDLVPGDILVVNEGLKIPADARIIYEEQLIADEASLTGESAGIEKTDQPLVQKDVSTFDQINMIFKGTYILSGSGKAIVTATGSEAEIGKFQETIKGISLNIPIQKEVTHISYIILIFCALLGTLLLLLSAILGIANWEIFLTLTALIVAIIPEGLPVMLTLTLTYGAYNMAKKKVLVKKLQAVDTLGRVDVMVLDKTGTLTRNEMMVTNVFADNTSYTVTGQGYNAHGSIIKDNKPIQANKDSILEKLAIAAALLGRSVISFSKQEKRYIVIGDPTEAALTVFADKVGFNQDRVHQEFEKIYHFPFTPETRYHAGFFKHNNHVYLFTVGSPEVIRDFCNGNGVVTTGLDEYLHQGLRVVAAAYKEWPEQDFIVQSSSKENFEKQLLSYIVDLTFLGLYGVQDTIRPGVDALIKQARRAGMHIVMATGDHKDTATHIAQKVGIFQEGDCVLTGTDITSLSVEELSKKLAHTTVCARVTPNNKVKIIESFHKLGNVVSMTGDGVNDVPSLVAADVGIAMGMQGTDVAKNAADLVLLDDSFASIIEGIQWGKHTYFTVHRVILYLLATNLGEALLITFSLLLTQEIPLTLMQILWINIVTDGFLDLALIFEPKKFNLIGKKIPQGRLLTRTRLIHILLLGLLMSLGTLILFYYYRSTTYLTYARTMALICMALFQWFNAWNNRSEEHSLYELGLLSNKWLIMATCLVAGMTLAVVYIPLFQRAFQTVPITLNDWAIAIITASSILIIEELRKYIFKLAAKQ